MSDDTRKTDVEVAPVTGSERGSMPVSERRRFLQQLALGGVAIPSAILLVDGTRNVAFAC